MIFTRCLLCLLVMLQTGCSMIDRDVTIHKEGNSRLHLTATGYDKVLLSPVTVTHASDRQVSQRILRRFEQAIHDDLHEQFAHNVQVVSEAQAGTLQLDITLAKVHTSLEDMSIGELFPYRAALEGMILVLGERDRDVHVVAKYQLTDALTQQLLAERETVFTLEAVLENDESHLQYYELMSLKPEIQQDILLFAMQVSANHLLQSP